MTEFQPRFDLNYAHGVNPRSTLPGSITVMSILAVVFGSLGVACNGIGLVIQAATMAMGGRNPFMPNITPMHNPAMTAYGAVVVVIDLVLSGILLGAGIGGLKVRPAARRILVLWSVAVLVWATVNLIVQLTWFVPTMAAYSVQVQAQVAPQSAQMMASMAKPMQMAGAVLRWLLWCILPVCFLILWRSRKVVQAFEGDAGSVPPAAPNPPQYPPSPGYGG